MMSWGDSRGISELREHQESRRNLQVSSEVQISKDQNSWKNDIFWTSVHFCWLFCRTWESICRRWKVSPTAPKMQHNFFYCGSHFREKSDKKNFTPFYFGSCSLRLHYMKGSKWCRWSEERVLLHLKRKSLIFVSLPIFDLDRFIVSKTIVCRHYDFVTFDLENPPKDKLIRTVEFEKIDPGFKLGSISKCQSFSKSTTAALFRSIFVQTVRKVVFKLKARFDKLHVIVHPYLINLTSHQIMVSRLKLSTLRLTFEGYKVESMKAYVRLPLTCDINAYSSVLLLKLFWFLLKSVWPIIIVSFRLWNSRKLDSVSYHLFFIPSNNFFLSVSHDHSVIPHQWRSPGILDETALTEFSHNFKNNH